MFDAITYNRLFTLHGVVMIFLFLIPAIPAAFGNFVVPLMLGARDVAFPRLNLLSFYLYWIGAIIAIWGMINGGADTGWTFYTPYSSTSPTQVAPILLGAFVLGFSSILTGLNFIVTTHTLRAPGLNWMKLPLFVWGIYATSIIQILATPVLGISLLLVTVERIGGFGLFDPARGGDPVLFQHFFWFYSHPAVYIMVLPAMGVISATGPSPSAPSASPSWASSPGGTTSSSPARARSSAAPSACSRCSWGSSPPSRSSTGSARCTAAPSPSRRRSRTSAGSSTSSSSAA
jgi:cytochrome c oxidase subunit 1